MLVLFDVSLARPVLSKTFLIDRPVVFDDPLIKSIAIIRHISTRIHDRLQVIDTRSRTIILFWLRSNTLPKRDACRDS